MKQKEVQYPQKKNVDHLQIKVRAAEYKYGLCLSLPWISIYVIALLACSVHIK
jgi:hypothetical protein